MTRPKGTWKNIERVDGLSRCIINGVDCLLTFEQSPMPKEKYPFIYYARHSDRSENKIATVENFPVFVNRFGTILASRPIELNETDNVNRRTAYDENGVEISVEPRRFARVKGFRYVYDDSVGTIEGRTIVALKGRGTYYSPDLITAYGEDGDVYRIDVDEFLKLFHLCDFKIVQKRKHKHLSLIVKDEFEDQDREEERP